MKKMKTILILLIIIQSLFFSSIVFSSELTDNKNLLPKDHEQKITNSNTENYNLNKLILLDENTYTSDLVISQDSQGFIYILGRVKRVPTSYNNMMLSKWNSNGIELWEKQWNHNGMDVRLVSSLLIDEYGSIYTLGSAYDSSGSGQVVCMISKLDSNGSILWSRFYFRTDDHPQIPFTGEGIALDKDNNILVTGTVGSGWSGVSIPYVFIAKYDGKGSLTWENSTSSISYFNADLRAFGRDVITDTYGNAYLLAEYSASTYFLKYDSNGQKLWQKAWAGAYNLNEFLYVDTTGVVHLSGSTSIGSFSSNGSFIGENTLESADLTFMDSNHNIYTLIEAQSEVQFHKWNENGSKLNDYDYKYTFTSTKPTLTDFVVDQDTTYAVGIVDSSGYLAIFKGVYQATRTSDPNTTTGTGSSTSQTASYQSYVTNSQTNTSDLYLGLLLIGLIGLGLFSAYLLSENKNLKKQRSNGINSNQREISEKSVQMPRNQYPQQHRSRFIPRFCNKCGSPLEKDDVFCFTCGNKII